MNLFSAEEKKEFEAVGVDVHAIEIMLKVEYHQVFKELIQSILSGEKDTTNGMDLAKKDLILLNMEITRSAYTGLAKGLDKQYHYVKSDGFLGAYTSLDSHKGEWVPLIYNFTAMHKEMKGKDKEVYLALPEKVIIYRGASEEEIENTHFGLSWSLNQEVARKFAIEMDPTKDKVIYKAIVDKSSISAYTNARNEEECIININLNQEDIFYDVEII